jgi:hypothetical protein
MQLLRRDQWKTICQRKPHLSSEYASGSCSGSVCLVYALIDDIPKVVEILAHAERELKGFNGN